MAQENCAREAPQGGSVPAPIRAFGARRINLEMRARLDEADKFTGLPKGTAKPFEFLAAFEQAEPYLGLPAQASKLVAWLVRLTESQDWEDGSRPIAWPSADRQVEFLGGISLRAMQLLNRRLWEAGIFVMRDDPQGRRYGNRDARTGRITKAFGFDLSPLALRYEEFKKIAADAQAERNRMRKLRRQATLARRGIKQALEELGVQGQDNEAIRQLDRETDDLVVAARACRRSDELAVAVKSLERRRHEAEQMLRDLIKPVETGPMGEENDAHSTSTQPGIAGKRVPEIFPEGIDPLVRMERA
jgi:replication initiation protein RepC